MLLFVDKERLDASVCHNQGTASQNLPLFTLTPYSSVPDHGGLTTYIPTYLPISPPFSSAVMGRKRLPTSKLYTRTQRTYVKGKADDDGGFPETNTTSTYAK